MTETRVDSSSLHHRIRRMTGRDPDESHRVATPLELLFDLTFVVSFGLAADQLAHLLAEGHVAAGVSGFAFAMVAVSWAWMNCTWFASAYDTDDWVSRVATMGQMVGVLILALGLPDMFHSIDAGEVLHNDVMVAGYVVIRVALVAQWLRAAQQDLLRRRACLAIASVMFLAQVGWVSLLFIRTAPPAVLLPVIAVVVLLDFFGPWFVEARVGGTPWHAHHLAERNALLVIIALGESIFGTIASVSAIVQREGWSPEAIVIVVAGTALTFGMWWSYFILPSGIILQRYREKVFLLGYAHILVLASIAATGAGLHVAAYLIEGEAHINEVTAVVSVVVPVFVFLTVVFVLYSYLVAEVDPFHFALMLGTIALLVLAVVLVSSGVSMGVSLLITAAAPVVVVVGYETLGYRHEAVVLARRLGPTGRR
jgi:low temperature requirement protein LtrA